MQDAAIGMEYLHWKNIVHFDLKCENLLVNLGDPHRPVCKVIHIYFLIIYNISSKKYYIKIPLYN